MQTLLRGAVLPSDGAWQPPDDVPLLFSWIQKVKHFEHSGTELQPHCSRIAIALYDSNVSARRLV
jgi:hypothetical protein